MIEKFSARLFLTDSERETLLELMDVLSEADPDTMEEWDKINGYMVVICRLIFGKARDDRPDIYPISSNIGKE